MTQLNDTHNDTRVPASQPARSVQVAIELQSVDQSDQPVLANFTAVQGAPGMVFLDFGFLEPQAINKLTRQAQTGSAVPKVIRGRLACRVAMSPEAIANLAQQLKQFLRPAVADEHTQVQLNLPEAAQSDTSLH